MKLSVNTLDQRRRVAAIGLSAGIGASVLIALLLSLRLTAVAAPSATTWYVHPNGSDSDTGTLGLPFATIQHAIDVASDDDTILVAAGTYTETLNIHSITLTLRGGYTISGTAWLPRTGETVIDANGADDAAVWIYPGANVTVEDFAVQGANHTSEAGGGFFIDRATVVISGAVVRNNAGDGGGGIYVEKWEGYPGSLTLINSSLLMNTSTEDGGGLKSAGWPTVTLDNVVVQGNAAQGSGGGLLVGQVTIHDSQIVSNTSAAPGGGINADLARIYDSEISYNEVNGVGELGDGGMSIHAELHLENSVVRHNRAVGTVYSGASGFAVRNGAATIVNSRISDNENGDLAVAFWSSHFTVTNSLVVNNDGHGIVSDENPVTGTMMNVTIAGNGTNGLQMTGGDVRVTNSILWGNGGEDNQCAGNCTLTYSDIGTGDTSGTGNISADPKFVDAADGDYHLQVGSPCIDKGTSAGAPAADIEGTPRDAAPDMGAYEWTGFRIFLPLTLRNFGP